MALPAPDASAGRPSTTCWRHVAVARPAGLRVGPALAELALRAARLLPPGGIGFLVSRCAAVSQPATLVRVALVAVSDPGRHPEHGAFRLADFLWQGSLSLLRAGTADRKHL